MKKKIKLSAVVLAVLLMATLALPITAFASTTKIELETRSILLVDRSGSIEDREAVDAIVSNLETALSFDAVGYFDTEVSAAPSFEGGGNSNICEAIDKAASAGFTHITVITDGEQWPADYSSLGLYSDLDLTIHLVEETNSSKELVLELMSRLENSSLMVVKPDGLKEVWLDEYQPPVYNIEIPDRNSEVDNDVNNESEKTFIENITEGYFPWWIILIVAALIAAIFDFIHELIARGREENKEPQQQASTPTTVAPKPLPAGAIAQIAKGAHVLADFSGSMAKQQSETAQACVAVQKGSDAVLCFGDTVSEHAASEISALQAEGQTAGWEAMEQAAAKGWDELVLVSDLGFNGKAFDESAFPKKFKKVTVVTPESYYQPTLENIRKIAEEVEVLPL